MVESTAKVPAAAPIAMIDAIPFSGLASPAAARLFAAMKRIDAPSLESSVGELRAYYGVLDRRRAEEMRRRFPVDIEVGSTGGVPVKIVTPREGVSSANAGRVLINLHGGAFMWGGEYGGLVESIPIAALGGFTVVAVDYRQAPEHVHPAASEDVAAVYAELLDSYTAKSIGIYGCSAGGVLTAQAIVEFTHMGLPMPGALGTFCGTGLEFGGDSPHLAALTTRSSKFPKGEVRLGALPYFGGAAADDSRVFPLVSDDWARRFPPTLMIAGGRDFAASSLTLGHRRLASVDCDSRLFLFDGLWHAFFADPELPESGEAYDLICRFFLECLG